MEEVILIFGVGYTGLRLAKHWKACNPSCVILGTTRALLPHVHARTHAVDPLKRCQDYDNTPVDKWYEFNEGEFKEYRMDSGAKEGGAVVTLTKVQVKRLLQDVSHMVVTAPPMTSFVPSCDAQGKETQQLEDKKMIKDEKDEKDDKKNLKMGFGMESSRRPSTTSCGRDPILTYLQDAFKSDMPKLVWVAYLSTIVVYGDTGGEKVDETAPLRTQLDRGIRRIQVEEQWLKSNLPVHIFRLPGIYGPHRSPFAKAREGTSQRVLVPGKVFHRCHVDDIAQIVYASAMHTGKQHSIYNVSDHEPAPNHLVVAYAHGLLNLPVPPLQSWEDVEHTMSSMAKSFYAEDKLVSNERMLRDLNVTLRYPTYREGLLASLAEETIFATLREKEGEQAFELQQHTCFVLHMGSMRSEAVLSLDKVCKALEARLKPYAKEALEILPVGFSMSRDVEAEECMDGSAIATLEVLLKERLEERGCRKFTILPVLCSESEAFVKDLSRILHPWQKKYPEMQLKMSASLVDLENEKDTRFASVVSKRIDEALSRVKSWGEKARVGASNETSYMFYRNATIVCLLDDVVSNQTTVRNHQGHVSLLAQQLRQLRHETENVIDLSYAFQRRKDLGGDVDTDTLTKLLRDAVESQHPSTGPVVVALVSLFNDCDAEGNRKVAQILEEVQAEAFPELHLIITEAIGAHALVVDILYDRFYQAQGKPLFKIMDGENTTTKEKPTQA